MTVLWLLLKKNSTFYCKKSKNKFVISLIKLNLYLLSREKLKEHGIRIRVIGNIRFLPIDLQKLVVEATESTKFNSKAVLNVAFSYTCMYDFLY